MRGILTVCRFMTAANTITLQAMYSSEKSEVTLAGMHELGWGWVDSTVSTGKKYLNPERN